MCTRSLYPDSTGHREQTERGLDGGAVDKLLVGLGEDNTLNLLSHSETNVFLKHPDKTISIHLYTNNTVQNVYVHFLARTTLRIYIYMILLVLYLRLA
jgi:hypothetical protein